MKKLLTILLAIVLIGAFGIKPASAGGGSDPTGPVSIAKDEISVKVCNFNMGDVYNLVLTGANTGVNHTLKGDSGTGAAEATATIGTGLNSSTTEVAVLDFQSGPVALNQAEEHHRRIGLTLITPMSFALAEDETEVRVHNLNFGEVTNVALTLANSGFNFTKKGDSKTGAAEATADLKTTLNTNDTGVLVMESGFGPTAMNMGHGGIAIAEDETEVKVTNANMGIVCNLVGTGANTGLNTTNKGSSSTGNATATSSVGNTVNSNTTDIAVIDMTGGPVAFNGNVGGEAGARCGEPECGDPEPDPTPSCLPGVCSGATTAANIGSSGVAVSEKETEVTVSNVNVGEVTNVVGTLANTGGNVTGTENLRSCTTVSSSTGDASATSNVSNTVNSNSTTVVVVSGGSVPTE